MYTCNACICVTHGISTTVSQECTRHSARFLHVSGGNCLPFTWSIPYLLSPLRQTQASKDGSSSHQVHDTWFIVWECGSWLRWTPQIILWLRIRKPTLVKAFFGVVILLISCIQTGLNWFVLAPCAFPTWLALLLLCVFLFSYASVQLCSCTIILYFLYSQSLSCWVSISWKCDYSVYYVTRAQLEQPL